MDFIYSNKKQPFVNDKSLWAKSLNKQPLYDELLGWHELYNQKGKTDTDQQALIRLNWDTRERWARNAVENGHHPDLATARGAWNAIWNAHPHPPSNYMMGAVAMEPWAPQNGIDYWGETIIPAVPGVAAALGVPAVPAIPARFQARDIEPNHKAALWLRENTDFRVTGWQGSPNKPIVKDMAGDIAAFIAANPGGGIPAGGWVNPASGRLVPSIKARGIY